MGKTFYSFASIGVVPMALVNAKFKDKITGWKMKMTGVNKFDIAFLGEVGAGYKFHEKYHLYLSIAFQRGFIDTWKESSIKNYGVLFSLGFKYAL